MIFSLLPRILASAVLLAGLAGASPDPAEPDVSRHWPQWRGPLGTGEAPQARPPLEWSGTKNVRWRADVPGVGKSSPIVWGDLVVITTAIPVGGATTAPGAPASGHPEVSAPGAAHEFAVLAYRRADGKLRWRRVVRSEQPHEGTHRDGTFASPSAVTDGQRIYAFFGSRGLHALDLKGSPVWQKDLGRMRTKLSFGEGASPALHEGTLVVNWDHEDADFVAAFDAATGREKWRRHRDEPTTWATPHVVVHGGRAQVVTGGTNRVRAYDLATGEPLWDAPGLTANVIPSPVSAGGVVYAMSGFRGNALRAIRLADARGEVTGPPALAWSHDRDTPYVPSPLLHRGTLYFLKSNSGVLTAMDATSGAVHYTHRLDAVPNVYASPVAADGRVYVVGREGTTVVLAAGSEPRVLAVNRLDDAIDASPALVDGEIYLRGARGLYRISAD